MGPTKTKKDEKVVEVAKIAEVGEADCPVEVETLKGEQAMPTPHEQQDDTWSSDSYDQIFDSVRPGTKGHDGEGASRAKKLVGRHPVTRLAEEDPRDDSSFAFELPMKREAERGQAVASFAEAKCDDEKGGNGDFAQGDRVFGYFLRRVVQSNREQSRTCTCRRHETICRSTLGKRAYSQLVVTGMRRSSW